MNSPATNQQKPSYIWLHMSEWPSATQAFVAAVIILALTCLVASFAPDKEATRPIITGGMDLLKVLVGAFAGSLTGKGKT